MSAIKNYIEDVISEMAYETVDYGLYKKETEFNWSDIQYCASRWLWDNREYVNAYLLLKGKTNLYVLGTFFRGLAQTMLEDSVMDYLEV